MLTDRDGASSSRLTQALELLKQAPERNREDVERGRRRFLAELDDLQEKVRQGAHSGRGAGNLRATYQQLKEKITMKLNNQKLVLTTLTSLVMVFVFLFGGAAATAYASQVALPGDALYPVKTRLEQTQASFSRDDSTRAKMYMSFAERRLDEITLLIAEGRVNDIEEATDEFEYYVAKAMEALQSVVMSDPDKASELTQEIFTALQRYSQALNDMAAQLPDPAKQAIQRAIMSSQSAEDGENNYEELVGVVEAITADTLVVDGMTFHIDANSEIHDDVAVGSTVKVEYTVNDDGSFSLHGVEVDDDLDEGNENGNENENDNEAEDENENEAEDDNENEAENENEDDQDDNANSNEDEDDDEDESGSGNDNEDVDADSDDDDSDDDSNDDNGDDSSDEDEDD